MPFSKQIICEAREGELGLSADRTQTGFWCSFSSLSCSCQLWTAWIGGSPQALLRLQSNLGHKICLWVNMQMKRYHHPTFFPLNYKDRHLLGDLFALQNFFLLGSPDFHLSYFAISWVLWLLGWHITLPLQLQSPILLESAVLTAHLGVFQTSPRTVHVWSHSTSSAVNNHNGELAQQLSPICNLLCQNFIRYLDVNPSPSCSYSSAHQAKIKSRSYGSTLRIVTRFTASWVILYI